MSSASYKHLRSRKNKAEKGSARFVYLAIVLCVIGLIVVGIAFRSSQPTQAATNQYAGIAGPDDWTDETPVQIYNRSNGQWEPMTYGYVGPDMEFIVCIYIPLLDEGVLVIRPTTAERLGDDIFRVLPAEDYSPTTEVWAFPPGTLVQCVKEVWEGKEVVVAKREYHEML